MLTLDGISKRLGGKRVLERVSLRVERGESLVIMGPSGSGKTALLKHLIGLHRPDQGEVRVDGRNLWSMSEADRTAARRRFGIAFQEGALFDSLSVFDNVAFPLRRQRDREESEVKRRVRECLALVRLNGVEDRHPNELSTGMRRRVGFARAIALQPEFLLFDEPTAALDPVMVTVMIDLIRRLTRTLHCTTVMVTHDLRAATAVADRVALLHRGAIVVDLPLQEFLTSPSPFVRQLINAEAEGPLSPSDELESPGAPA